MKNEKYDFSKFSDEKIKEKYDKFSINDNIFEIIAISIEALKRSLKTEFNELDYEILCYLLNSFSINISNQKAFKAFLVYSSLVQKLDKTLHCLFVNNFTMFEVFNNSTDFYDFLNIKFSINELFVSGNFNNNFKAKIIFSDWQETIFNYLNDNNSNDTFQKLTFKFDCAFIFDIDRVIYDFEKCVFELRYKEKINKIKIQNFFRRYETIIGVSKGTFFEQKKIEKNYNIKIQNLDTNDEILEFLKIPNNLYYKNKEDKIIELAKYIENLYEKEKTVIVDVDKEDELELLLKYLEVKKVPFNVINNDNPENFYNALNILTPKKITILTNLISTLYEMNKGGECRSVSILRTNSFKIDYKTNFYKEKFKKEIIKQKENIKKNIEKLKSKNEIYLLFSQHYTELKNEYLAIVNLSELLKKENILFFNSPEDEIYKHFHFDKLSIFKIEQNQENIFIFNAVSKILFNLRNLAYKNFLIQNQEKLVYYIELNDNDNNEKLSFKKLKKKGK